MSLIAILLSLALEKFLPGIDTARNISWFAQFSDWLRQHLNKYPWLRETPALLLTILLPVIGIAVAQTLFDDILRFLGFLFGIAVLTYCLGPRNPLYTANHFLDATDQDDSEAAKAALEALLQDEAPAQNAEPYETMVTTLLVQTHERITGVLFWFIVLGPIGAVLYRLAMEQDLRERLFPHADDPGFASAAYKLHGLLAWIPSRLTALGYAVIGSFTHALQAWQGEPGDEDKTADDEITDTVPIIPESHRLLRRVGLGALQFEDGTPADIQSVRETFGLCSRSIIAWLTVLALLTLAGWIA